MAAPAPVRPRAGHGRRPLGLFLFTKIETKSVTSAKTAEREQLAVPLGLGLEKRLPQAFQSGLQLTRRDFPISEISNLTLKK